MSLQLKKFDMKRIKDDQVVVLIGKRNTGKSFMTRDLLYYHQDIPSGVVICPTEGANKFYTFMVPPIFIHKEYTPKITNDFVKRQQQLTFRIQAGEKNIDRRAFLIMDDCLYDNDWKKDKRIREIFMNGRHWGIMFVLLMQYAIGIPPNLRTNIDWVFILRDASYQNRKKLYECYASIFPTFDMFCQTMDQCTDSYGCLIIENCSKSNKLEEQVFWYKADAHPDFRICCNEAWKFSDLNYVEENSDDDEGYEMMYAKKNKPRMTVKKLY